MHSKVSVGVLTLVFTVLLPISAWSGMPMPLALEHYEKGKGAKVTCGLRADYELAGSPMRVEFETRSDDAKIRLTMRAYAPNTMNSPIRDVWLRTKTLFTVGIFKPGYMNSNGITEASGLVANDIGMSVLEEVQNDGTVFSIIVDGPLPTSRMAVGVPGPLPGDVGRAFGECVRVITKK